MEKGISIGRARGMEKRRKFMKNFRATRTLYLFVIPGLIYYALFKYWPIIRDLYIL